MRARIGAQTSTPACPGAGTFANGPLCPGPAHSVLCQGALSPRRASAATGQTSGTQDTQAGQVNK